MALSGRCACGDCLWDFRRLIRLSDCSDHLLGSPVPNSLRQSSCMKGRSGGGPVVLKNLASSRRLSTSACSSAILLISPSIVPGGRPKASKTFDVDLDRGRRACLRLSRRGRPSGLAGCGWKDSSPLDREWRRGRDRLIGIIQAETRICCQKKPLSTVKLVSMAFNERLWIWYWPTTTCWVDGRS
jgi:hypothetical protein